MEILDVHANVALDDVFSARGWDREGSGAKDKSHRRVAIARNQRHQHVR